MNEVWRPLKDIVECGDNYEISNLGRVRNLSGKTLSLFINPRGYANVHLYLTRKRKRYSVHRLVALAFIDNPKGKPEVNHKDGVKHNNEVGNLEWNTKAENENHARRTGLTIAPKGEKHYRSSLTDNDVVLIKKLLLQNTLSQAEIGKQFGVSREVVRGIQTGAHWKHVKVEGFTPFTGKKSVAAKLTKEQATQIKQLYLSGGYTMAQVSKKFSVSTAMVSNIVTGKRWKGV